MKVATMPTLVQCLVSPTRRTVQRKALVVDLHPNDYSRVVAAASQLDIPPDDFYALAIHVGATTLLRDKGLELGPDNLIKKLG
jgi:hypothetical protein